MSATFPADEMTVEDTNVQKFDGKKVTIYNKSEMFGSIRAIRAKLFEVGTMKYAQYPAAPFVVYQRKGKRKKARSVSTGFKPYLIVVEGWDAPEPASLFGDAEIVDHGALGKIQVKMSRHSSFDDRWMTDFDAVINPLIASGEIRVVADHRSA